MQKLGHRRTGITGPWKLGLFQAGTKLTWIGCIGIRGSSHKPLGTSAGRASHHGKEKDRKQHRRKKRGKRNGDHDALATATKIRRLSLCQVRTAVHERLGVPAENTRTLRSA